MGKTACKHNFHYTRYDFAAAELVYALKQLKSDQSFNVVLFNDAPKEFRDEPVPATAANILEVSRWLGSQPPGRSTNIETALKLAGTPDSVYLLSDGVPILGCKFRELPCPRTQPELPKTGLPVNTVLFMPVKELNVDDGRVHRRRRSVGEWREKERVGAVMKGIANYTGGSFREPFPLWPKKCPPRVGHTLLVEGCGVPEANGMWQQAGFLSGRPRYEKSNFVIEYTGAWWDDHWQLVRLSYNATGAVVLRTKLYRANGIGRNYKYKFLPGGDRGWKVEKSALEYGAACKKVTMDPESMDPESETEILVV
jgi:hypothetical protein